MLPGVLRYEDGIEVNQDIVVITTKGEAICTGEGRTQVKPHDELNGSSSSRAVMTCYLSPFSDGLTAFPHLKWGQLAGSN